MVNIAVGRAAQETNLKDKVWKNLSYFLSFYIVWAFPLPLFEIGHQMYFISSVINSRVNSKGTLSGEENNLSMPG